MDAESVRPLGSRYRLTAQVGRGGMGEVWRGVDTGGRARAFKLLLPHYAQDPDVVRRFLAERQLLMSVRDPHVVGVYDLVIEGTTLGIVMDLVDGPDLRHYLREQGTLPSAVACRIGAQVASGLAAVHAARIVHRDVKPENVLLDLRGDMPLARLTDFGVAKVLEDTSMPAPTAVAGTPNYMAPEVINGLMPTTQSDLYSFGILMYEMLCGVTPFAGLASGPMMQAHLSLDPGRPEGIDDRVWQLIRDLVSKSAADRPGDAGAVAGRLSELAVSTAGVGALPKLAGPPTAVPTTRPAIVFAETQVSPVAPPSGVPDVWGGQPGRGTPAQLSMLPTVQGQPGAAAQLQPGGWVTPVAAPGAAYLTPSLQMAPSPPAYVTSSATPSSAKSKTPMLVGIIVGLLIVFLVVVGYLTLGGRVIAGDDSAAAGPVSAASEASQEPAGAAPSPSLPSTEAPESLWPPAGTTPCPDTDAIVVNSVTSCQFAANVAAAAPPSGTGTVRVYSPVTNQHYTMTCSTVEASIVTCSGGNDARVWIRR